MASIVISTCSYMVEGPGLIGKDPYYLVVYGPALLLGHNQTQKGEYLGWTIDLAHSAA